MRPVFCPECGGEAIYDLGTKLYTCRNCGLTLSYSEILEARRRNLPPVGEEEKKRRERKEYLQWWLSKK